MIRIRPGAVLAAALACALAGGARDASAAAEVHKLSLVISGIPTQVSGGDFNDTIEQYNTILLRPLGREGLSKVQFGWLFEAQLRYFVRSNVAVDAGVGQLRTQTKREFLPALQQDINIRGEVLTVPVHAGAAYYLAPYNQGDFQARAYLGAGFVSNVYNKALLQQVESNTDSSTSLGGSFTRAATRDAPGYYVEGGVHMFFAIRYSVMLSVMYRSAVIRGLLDRDTGLPLLNSRGKPYTLDMGGIGGRMGIAIGL